MNEGVFAVFIPIVLFLVIGLVIVTYVYFRSRERQLLVEKGLPPESIKEFFESKRDPYALMKTGIIIVAFGLGLGFGLMLDDATGKDYYVVLSMFTLSGVGFVVANMISRNLAKKEGR